MTAATRELLASVEDVWSFLAEPYHLPDWWPGALSVQPDRRGFAPGARWQVQVVADPLRLWIIRLPGIGRPSGPSQPATLVITAIDAPRRAAFELHRRTKEGSDRGVRPRSVEVTLRALEPDRTEVGITVATGGRDEPQVAETAVDRLYDLVQTAAEP